MSLLFLLTAAFGCSVPHMDEKDFLTVEPLGVLTVVTAPVSVGKLNPTMPAGTSVGNIYNRLGKAEGTLRSGIETRGAYRKVFYEELKKAGYVIAGQSDQDGARSLPEAVVVIGGDIIDVKVNAFESPKPEENAEYAVSILWRVFDRRSEREIFQTQTTAAARAENIRQAEEGAFRSAFLKLLAESAFVDTLTGLQASNQ